MSKGVAGLIRGLWDWFWRPSAKFALGTLLVIGVVVGGGGIIVFNAALDHSNSTEFCTGCHEMAGAPFEEYKQSAHASNRTGVRAGCPDCHVPKSGPAKLLAKLSAAKDVYHTILGTINTPEKYEAMRLDMAKGVWAKMKATDSRECRSCHSFEGMKFDAQDKSASKKHQKTMKQEGDDRKTCIDCHKGIAHKKPSGSED
ncbi:MAG: NapC/NirT family cytochrome c [Alphaproteobacteria bacterium]